MKKITSIILSVVISLLVVSTVSCKNLSEGRTTYEISVELNDDMTADCQTTVTYYNTTEVVMKELKFNLYGNAFRKDAKYSPISIQNQSNAYPNGKSYGEMSGFKVFENGKEADFSVDGEDENVLTVRLSAEVYPEETTRIKIEYTLKLANVVARTGYNGKTVNLGNFYPILCVYDGGFYECNYYANGDPFFSECADYKTEITLSSDYVVAGAGKKISEKTTGEKTTHVFKLDNARSYAMVLGKDFSVKSTNYNDILVNYFYYNDAYPDETMEYITKSLGLFSEKFGVYAYNDYTVVQTKFVQGGMEYPTLVMISDELERAAYGEVVVHETAHQWWQTAVGNNEVEHAFMDEGLAEYSVIIFYENYPEYGMTRDVMVKSAEQTYKTYCTVYDKIFNKTDTTMIRKLCDFDSEYEYVNIAYIKSCLMMEYLRQTIGDARFFSGLKRYYKIYRFSIATPDDLSGAFEKVGADTNGFFDSFYNGKVIL